MLFVISVDTLNVKIISYYFDKSFEKIDLSDNSNPKKESKKIKDGNSGSFSDHCDIFEVRFESPACK